MDLQKCSYETTKQGESSNSMEITEESPGVAISPRRKRKAESELAEEESEPAKKESDSDSEEKNAFFNKAYMCRSKLKDGKIVYCSSGSDSDPDPDHHLIKPPWWKAPKWDVDSFDELEYDSAEEAKVAKVFKEEADIENWSRFKRQLIQNKGFYVDPELWSFYRCVRLRVPRDLEGNAGHGQTYREYYTEMAHLCLKKYNKLNREKNGFDVEFVEVVRAMYTSGSRSKSYITFMAKERPDGPPVEYQCKVWCTFVKGQNFPILCRPAPLVKKF